MNFHKLPYRPEIDGLRAIAVVSVIIYHAKFHVFDTLLLEGGFIGVDIFFVISGYLITRIILFDLISKKSFNFINFYERRARRILPVFYLVIFATFPTAWQLFSNSDFIEYAQSVLASLFFSSNFYFYFNTTEYGANSSLLKPLLHTWSLGIEEQFYLFFPILATLLYNHFRSHFLLFIVLILLSSLLFANTMAALNADLNFYLPFSRFWELAAGSFLAYRELFHKSQSTSLLNKFLPIIGFSMIIYSILFFNSDTPHPSFYTVIPVLGVSLLIGFSNLEEPLGRFLANKTFVLIGLISYSAYLWHFPVFAFFRYSSLYTSNYDKIFWIIFTFLISFLSYHFVEQPFRNRKITSGAIFYFSVISSVFLILSLNLLVIGGSLSNIAIKRDSSHQVDVFLDKRSFDEEHENFEIKFDYSIKQNSKKNILIVGNSHAEDLLKILSFSYLSKDYNLNLTSPIRRTRDINYQIRCFLNFIEDGDTTCTQGAIGVVEYGPHIKEQYSSADIIVLAPKWKEQDIKTLRIILKRILADGKKAVVVSNTPQSEVYGERELNRFDAFLFLHSRLPNESELNILEKGLFSDYIKNISPLNDRLRDVVNSMSSENVVYADRTEFMCNLAEERCFLFFPSEGVKVLYDYGHTTTDGARVLGRILSERRWLEGVL